MTRIDAGLYDVYCGQVKLEGADGALARVLRHSPTMRHDAPEQEMTADPPAASATRAAV
jgi:hypothetical protein